MLFAVVGFAGLVLLGTFLGSADVVPTAPQTVRNRLVIVTAGGASHKFNIEIAETPEQKAYGLMFRRDMEPDAGMLFPFGQEQAISMWMKNTYLPLDMIFADSAGVITRIHKNAVPESLETIDGGFAAAVLEVNAGTADRLGISPGDVMRHPVFSEKN